MPTKYVEGEEEQLAMLLSMAVRALAKQSRTPVPQDTRELLQWLAHESFRRGYSHAHTRSTLKDDLSPDDEGTK